MTTPGRRPGGGDFLTAADDLRVALEELRGTREMDDSDLREVAGAVAEAITEAYLRAEPDSRGVEARVDLLTGLFELSRLGDDGERVRVEPAGDVARQAAQAARAALAGRLRELERDRVIREALALRGELVDAIVERSDGSSWWVRVSRFTALLPPEEQLPEERLERQQHLKVVVIDARRRGRDAVVVVSRSHPSLLRRLLEQEVPELADGRVVVKGVARDPGRRSKVAVQAVQAGIDPQGACIGPRGVRIRAVNQQLGEEQVQVVAWSPDPAALVAGALGPAEVLRVDLDPDSRTAHVTVPASQLSLAIGRAGENARLAARLTGWRIDIAAEEGPE